MYYDQSNFLQTFLKAVVSSCLLFVYKNELKLCKNQCFLLRLKTIFSNKLHFTYHSFYLKNTLILSIFSKQQSFHAILS